MSISEPAVRRYSGPPAARVGGWSDLDERADRARREEDRRGPQEGDRDERGTGTGWHTQGRIRPRVGRKARTLGHQWSPLWRLGDLPAQGIARPPESAVRGA